MLNIHNLETITRKEANRKLAKEIGADGRLIILSMLPEVGAGALLSQNPRTQLELAIGVVCAIGGVFMTLYGLTDIMYGAKEYLKNPEKYCLEQYGKRLIND